MAPKRRWKQPDKRMEAAVRMRAAGWSLRRIAGHLGVNEITVRRDLARWETENVDQLLRQIGATSSSAEGLDVASDVAPNVAPQEDL